MQRLFSTFAGGWPGAGLLVQRLITGMALLHQASTHLQQTPSATPVAPQIIGVGLGMFLLAGLWTPVVGALIAVVEIWAAVAGAGDPWTLGVLASLGATLAMIGPGAYSMDARLFGRKQLAS